MPGACNIPARDQAVLPALVAWTPEKSKFILERKKLIAKSLGEFLKTGEPQWAKQKVGECLGRRVPRSGWEAWRLADLG